MSKLLSLIRRAPKRVTAVVAMIAAAIIVPVAVFAYGPVDRATFTFANPAPYVTFNSITDNPSVGDERNFVRVREKGTQADYDENVSLQAGKTYQVMVYYHNNAATSLNASGAGIAKDVTLRMQMPGEVTANTTSLVSGFINSSNANPTSVWDSANMKNETGDKLYLRYVPASAKVTSNGAVNGATLPDSFLTSGTPLGYDSLNGSLPGCNQFAGYVIYEFVVDKPDFSVEKQVSVDGGKTWSTNAQTTPGSTILYRVIYTNKGTTQQDNVTVKDTLPANVSYVPGSTLVASAFTGGGYKAASDGVTAAGLNIGSYGPTSNAYVKFSAKVADNATLPTCGVNTLHNVANVITSTGTKEASADVKVNKECQPGKITVCELSTKKIVTIDEKDFDSNKYTKDLSKCADTPPELPKTGTTENIVAIVGLGALIASLAYYIASRRALNQ
ncbi:MAG: LPXTG cell wall anchor domain-containing protein [Candidatus Microsaccharimonas sp.]